MKLKTPSSSLAVHFVSAAVAWAAGQPKAVGTWDVVATTPNGELASVITIKVVDGQIKAEVETGGVKRPVTEEKLEGAVLRMKVQYEATTYDVELKIQGDTVEGTWQGSADTGTLKGKRRP